MARTALLALFLLAACFARPGTPVAERGEGVPGWLPLHTVISPRAVAAPLFGPGADVRFRLDGPACSDLADAMGPSDCATDTRRSTLLLGHVWDSRHPMQTGERYLSSFEIFLPADLAVTPRRGPGGTLQSPLTVARWSVADRAAAPLFELELDSRRGLTAAGRTCVPPEGFGRWHRIYLRSRWARDDTGYLELRCDGDLHWGTPVLSRDGVVTVPTGADEPAAVPVTSEYGLIWTGTRPPPRSVSEVRMRRIYIRRLYLVLGRDRGG